MKRNILKNSKVFLITSSLLASSFGAWSQVNVQSTGGTSTATYTTLSDAFTAINAGTHLGVVDISITGNVTEPATTVDLTNSGNASVSQVNIKPLGGNFTISGNNTTGTKGVIQLVGASNVTIDGDDPNIPGERNLTVIAPTGTNTARSVIKIASDAATKPAENIIVKNLNLIGSRATAVTTTSSYGIMFANATASTTAAYKLRNITIENNRILRAYQGIYANGQTANASRSSNIVIKKNVIGTDHVDSMVSFGGIYLSYMSTDTTPLQVVDNDIQVGSPEGSTALHTNNVYGIQLSSGNESAIIARNNIHDIRQGVTSGRGAAGIHFSGSSSNDHIVIANNFIRDVVNANELSSISSSYLNSGIYISVGVKDLNVINNTIVLNKQNLSATAGNFTSANIYITNSSATIGKFYNNILVNKQNSDSAFNFIVTASATAQPLESAAMNNNCYFSQNNAYVLTLNVLYNNINDWKAYLLKDANSFVEAPTFTSATDLHIASGTFTLCESGGAPIATTGINVDIDQQVRPGTSSFGFGTDPDIGADEFDGRVNYTCVTPPNPGNTIIENSFVCKSSTIGLTIQNVPTGTGLSLQWQSSLDGITYTNIPQANFATYSFDIDTPKYFRLKVDCAAGNVVGYSNPVKVDYANSITNTFGATNCGYKPATLVAHAANNGLVRWFNDQDGSTLLHQGDTFRTPLLTVTDTFYAAPYKVVAGSVVVGAGNANNATYVNPFYSNFSNTRNQYLIKAEELLASGLMPGNITSMGIKINSGVLPMSNVNLKIAAAGITTLDSFYTGTFTDVFSAVSMTPNLGLNTINFTTPFLWDGTSNIVLQYCFDNPGTTATMASSVVANSVVGYNATIHSHRTIANPTYSICDTVIGTPTKYTVRPQFTFGSSTVACYGEKAAVIALVTTPPSVSLTPDATICNGSVMPLTIDSNAGNYNQVFWYPTANLFTDAAGTIPYDSNASALTVYYKSSVAGQVQVVARMINSAGCQNFDTVGLIVLPSQLEVRVQKRGICQSGSSSVDVLGTPNLGSATVQWQESLDNVNFQNITNATGLSYTTPVQSVTKYYRAVILNGTTVCAGNAIADTFLVLDPSITSVTNLSSCDTGVFNLSATTVLPNSTFAWYDSATAATPLTVATIFATPSINTSSTFYVAARSGSKDTISVITGTASSSGFPNPFNKAWGGNRHQYLYKADELIALGMSAGPLNGLALDIVTLSTNSNATNKTMNDLTIRMKNAQVQDLAADFDTANLSVVYNTTGYLPTATGWNDLMFQTPFFWDGVSNVIVEFTSNSGNNGAGGEHKISLGTTNFVSTHRLYDDNILPATAASVWTRVVTGTKKASSDKRANIRFFRNDICEGPRVPVTVTIAPKVPAVVNPDGNVGLCDGNNTTLTAANIAPSYTWMKNGTVLPVLNSNSITVSDTGQYQLVTFNNICYDTSAVINVQIAPNPLVDLGTITEFCPNDSLILNAQNANSRVIWDNGSTTSLRTIKQPGTYFVTVTNNFGCIGTDTIQVGLFAAPQPNLGADTAVCENVLLQLNPGVYQQYNWNTGTSSATISVANPGTYFVTIVDGNGCIGSDTIEVKHLNVAKAQGFSFLPYFYEQLGKVKFNAINPEFVTHYYWNFGDGTTSTQATPTHVYASEGNYDVTLKIWNSDCSETLFEQMISINNGSTDLSDLEVNKFIVYPNPAQNLVHVSFASAIGIVENIHVYDVHGRSYTMDFQKNSDVLTLNTSYLISGVYNLQIQTNEGVFYAKFEIVK